MRIRPIQLKSSNRLINQYRLQSDDVMEYFSYRPFDSLEKRVLDIQSRPYQRQALSDILYKMNVDWDAPDATLLQIERLKDTESVVVIGGQQAGLLTGPLYTLNKIMTIISFAKKQEQILNVPVIPVFWIAGEDHDYDEINHIYTKRNEKLYKHTSPQSLYLKHSISHIELDKEKITEWVQHAFMDLSETEHTKELYEVVCHCLNKSTTYVDFFARLTFKLFEEEGIVLIDSAHHDLRQLESKWFVQMIERQPFIAKEVYHTVQSLRQKGYFVDVDVESDDVHLFFHDENNERILLKKENEYFVGKNNEVTLTKEEILHIANNHPERLSNNVVTRPMMQELLFPTLAFFGGDGEISYWAALKSAFRALDDRLQLPPVIPRYSFTYVTKRVEKLVEARVISIEQILNEGLENERVNWLMSQNDPPIDVLFQEVKKSIDEIHAPLRTLAKEISADLGNEANKNLDYMIKNVTYLENRMNQKLMEKYEHELSQFTEIELALKPNEILQERVWNPLPFLNQYGLQLFNMLIAELKDLTLEEKHFAIYLD